MKEMLLPDIPRIYTALAEWASCILFVHLLKPIFSGWKRPILVGIMLLGQLLLQLLAGTFPFVFWVPGMILNIVWMFLTIYLISEETIAVSWITTIKAFIVAELSASIGWHVYTIILYQTKFDTLGFIVISAIIVFSIIGALIVFIERRFLPEVVQNTIGKRELVMATSTGIIIFSISNIGFVLNHFYRDSPFLDDSTTIFIIRSLVNISGMLLLYMQELQTYEAYLRKELTAIHNMFQLQYEQYRAFNENSDLIARKVHDLKHQIDVLRHETNTEKRQQYFKEIDMAIKNFESKIETGNAILDMVLTRKNQYCIQHDINFTCLVRGELINYMDIMDATTLFGNALDNAIESVEKSSDINHRLITLKVSKHGQFVIIRLDNYCIEDAGFSSSQFPRTSKPDKENHGYGLKSIEYIVKKYDGSMTIEQKQNWVQMKILLPIR